MLKLCQQHYIAWYLQQDVLLCGFLRSQSERLIETRITASFNIGNLSVGLFYPNIYWQIKQTNLKMAFSLHEEQDCSQRSRELRQCSIEFVCLLGTFILPINVYRGRFLTHIFLSSMSIFKWKSQNLIVVKARAVVFFLTSYNQNWSSILKTSHPLDLLCINMANIDEKISNKSNPV